MISATIVKNGTMTESQYIGLHRWVRKRLGTTSHCVECGTTSAKRYEWSNRSGKYLKQLSDWRRLCVSCHLKLDRQYKCRNGHLRSPQNTFYERGWRGCKICKKASARRTYLKYHEARKEKVRMYRLKLKEAT